MGQGGFAQARRTKQQHVVEGFFALARGGNKNFQLLPQLDLAHEIVHFRRPQAAIEQGLFHVALW